MVPQTADEGKAETGEEEIMEDQEPRDADEGDELEAAIMQTDHAFGAESVGTTAEEGLEGETLAERLAEERPERPSTDEALSVVDEGLSDDESELVGDAVTQRDEFASPEEAAMSVRDDVPGATDHDDPHPPDEDRSGG
jgi:hypothetical protein